MFEKVKTLHFESEAFKTPSNYDIFSDPVKCHTCLIYGRNGTGKSTLAKAFKKLRGNDADGIALSKLIGHGNTSITLTEEDRKSIYVFDEDYINSKIKIREDGLESIIMLGKQADIDDKIRAREAELKTAEKTLNGARDEYLEYTKAESPKNPEVKFQDAKTTLKQHWAVRRKEIMQLITNAPVADDKVRNTAKNPPSRTQEEIQKKYYENLNLLNSLRNNECHNIAHPVPDIPAVDENKIISLLAKKVEKPILTDRENRMVQLISEGEAEHLRKIRTVFSEPSVSECPFCYQPITQDYKKHLIESIQAAFNKEVEEHTQELEKAHMQPFETDFSIYYAADSAQCEKCKSQLAVFNDRINFCNEYLKTKINDPFSPIVLSDIGLEEAYLLLVNEFNILKYKVEQYNQSISNINVIQDRLNKMNDEIAFYEIISDYNTYLQKKKDMEAANEKAKSAEAEVDRIRREIEKLEQQKNQISIAVDIINSYLGFIFLDKGRLEIKCQDNKYVIRSRSSSVRPDAISVGERNIIALCYFFADMFSGKEEEDKYKNEAMVVIDDPVSSFDIDNRIGIISFLNSQFRLLLEGNENTRVVLMSHDLQTIDDIEKTFKAINVNNKWKNSTFLLENNTLKPKNNILNEYQTLIDIVYEYANGANTENGLTIGNTMRRVAEAFTTFEYKGGIDELLTHNVLDEIKDKTLREYFEGRIMKLYLNWDSHMQDRVKTLTNPGFTVQFSDADKRNTARDIICLLYQLNKPHITAYMKNKPGSIETVKQWCEDIRTVMGKGTDEDK